MKNISLRILCICLVMAASAACIQKRDSAYRKTMPLMDTVVSITVVADSKITAESAIEKAFAEISRFGDLINFYSEKSELAAINSNSGIRPTKVSPDTLELIEKAIIVAEKSAGAFDPSIGPVVRLWDFSKKKKPLDRDIRNALLLVNYRDIIINKADQTVFLRRKGMMLDLGAIAKGYAADLAVQSLKNSTITSGLVSIAGDIRAFGIKPDKELWTIGLKNPRQTDERNEILGTVKLLDKAISTAGDYERFFIEDGIRYHHILDPSTGYPINRCRSVSIIASKGVDADGFDTSIFVLGPEKGLKLAEDMGMDAIIMDSNGHITMTNAIKEKVSFEKGH